MDRRFSIGLSKFLCEASAIKPKKTEGSKSIKTEASANIKTEASEYIKTEASEYIKAEGCKNSKAEGSKNIKTESRSVFAIPGFGRGDVRVAVATWSPTRGYVSPTLRIMRC